MKRIAVTGTGPAGLFILKSIIDNFTEPCHISFFEKGTAAGNGMPYSGEGAGKEHVTNVSANEIPTIVTSIAAWIESVPDEALAQFNLEKEKFSEYKVLPRLLFGQYLTAQFQILLGQAKAKGFDVKVYLNYCVKDVKDEPGKNKVMVSGEDGSESFFDHVIISTGHRWPKTHEGKIKGWFDSPYPPGKLSGISNVKVAIKGASLTAIDAVRTIARNNGKFVEEGGSLRYEVNKEQDDFSIVLHSIDGLLPALRFHLKDTHLSQGHSYTVEELANIKEANDGFVPLDLVFETNFKNPLQQEQPELYETIKDMEMEAFVDHVMSLREKVDPFILFKAEYKEAEKSIKRRESVYWKEMLAVLSYEMNYAAKHFSAEDMLRLKKKLMPLVAVIIAFVPQCSADELIALHDAGILSVQAVDRDSEVVPGEKGGCDYRYTNDEGTPVVQHYPVFVNAVGQPHFMMDDFVFPSLVEDKTVSQAYVRFADAEKARNLFADGNKDVVETNPGSFWLKVAGVNINDNYQVLDSYGTFNPRIYIMAVPYMGGLNPDYSGLDFCERAGTIIAKKIEHTTEREIEAA